MMKTCRLAEAMTPARPAGERPMQTHLSGCYKGPFTRDRNWWPRAAEELENSPESVPSLDDPNIRADLVRRVRREIAAGTYDTPEKWEAALDRLLDRLERE